MVRALLALAAALGAFQLGATTIEVPTWLTILAPLITSGGFMVFYTARVEKRIKDATADKSEAETEEVYQRLYAKLGGTHAKLQHDLEVVQSALKAAEAKLDVARAERAASLDVARAERATLLAERDEITQRLTMKINALEDELATTRAEMGLIERRDPPGP